MESVQKICEQGEFLARIRLTNDEFARCGIEWAEIDGIHADYVALMPELSIAAGTILERLRQIPQIHSVKVRIKHPDSLIAKIIRKRLENPARAISRANFSAEITDLIGIRALHLFKDGWSPIDKFVQEIWSLGLTSKKWTLI